MVWLQIEGYRRRKQREGGDRGGRTPATEREIASQTEPGPSPSVQANLFMASSPIFVAAAAEQAKVQE